MFRNRHGRRSEGGDWGPSQNRTSAKEVSMRGVGFQAAPFGFGGFRIWGLPGKQFEGSRVVLKPEPPNPKSGCQVARRATA